MASVGYRCGMVLDQRRKANRRKSLPRPVLSIGNLTVGGTGKTPVVQFLARAAMAMGKRPAILSRGYGSSENAISWVDPNDPRSDRFGDEPALLAKSLPEARVYTGTDRYLAGLRAMEQHPDIDLFLLDDGFQHRQLVRDIDLVLVDSQRGFGNGRLLPWGPLREPISALDRATWIGWVDKMETETNIEGAAERGPRNFRISMGAVGWKFLGDHSDRPLEELPLERPAHLLSGIGNPEGFERTVPDCGLRVDKHAIFRDHHPFTEEEILAQIEEAQSRGRVLVTTAKDAVRMESLAGVWTEANRPIIIQLGLKSGDGANRLTNLIKSIFEK